MKEERVGERIVLVLYFLKALLKSFEIGGKTEAAARSVVEVSTCLEVGPGVLIFIDVDEDNLRWLELFRLGNVRVVIENPDVAVVQHRMAGDEAGVVEILRSPVHGHSSAVR
jgi:hypothetical protein